jgi:hypothetical protein
VGKKKSVGGFYPLRDAAGVRGAAALGPDLAGHGVLELEELLDGGHLRRGLGQAELVRQPVLRQANKPSSVRAWGAYERERYCKTERHGRTWAGSADSRWRLTAEDMFSDTSDDSSHPAPMGYPGM